MIDDSKYILRKATAKDIPFLADVIIAAEMSGSDNCGLANQFEITIEELRGYITKMLEEDVDGCEFSLSNFLIIEYDGEPVAAGGGWREGFNDSEMSSALIKSSLISCYIPKENVKKSYLKADIAKEIQINREFGTYQLEYAYVKKEHQGHSLYDWIIEELIERAQKQYTDLKKVQCHVFEANKAVPLLLRLMGFKVIQKFVSSNPETIHYYPDNVILLMEKYLNKK